MNKATVSASKPGIPAKINQNKSVIFLAVGLLIVFVLILVGFAAVVIRSRQNQSTNAVITDEDLKILTAGIKFTDAGSEKYTYQSPIYNFQVDINTIQYDFRESSRGINIDPKDYKSFATVSVIVDTPFSTKTATTLDKEVANYKKSLSSYKEGKVTSETDTQLDGIPAKQIKFTRKSFNGQPQVGIVVIAVKDNLIYQVNYANQDNDKDNREPEFNAFLASFKFIDSTKVNTGANYNSTLWGYQFDYNSKTWQLDSSSNSSVALNQRQRDFDSKDKVDVNMSSRELSRFDLLGKETTYLTSTVQERIGELQSNKTSYPGFKLNKQTEVTIDGKSAQLLAYEVDPKKSFYQQYFQEYVVLHDNAITKIVINYSNPDGAVYKEASNIISTFKFTDPTAGQVKGLTTSSDDEEKSILLARPAVVRIYDKNCSSISMDYNASLPKSSGKTYQVCAAATGSGFFVNSDGYVATNGHVVITSDYDLIYNSIFLGYSKDLLINIFQDYYEPALLAKNPGLQPLSEAEIIKVMVDHPEIRQEIATGIAKGITSSGTKLVQKSQIYVQRGTTPFLIDKGDLANDTEHLSATLVDSDYDANDDLIQGKASDVALLKVDKTGDYPVLKLSSNIEVNTGSPVLIIGFPGVATDTYLVSTDSRGEATVTRGIVSAVKTSNGGKKLIQTDASIQHGNSGGPGINRDAEVVGLATYGIPDSGAADFNLLRDVNDLAALMKKNSVENKSGKTESKWKEGIELFWNGKFSLAVQSLQDARKGYADLIETDNLITVAKSKIAQGLDFKEEVVKQNPNDVASFIASLSNTEKILFGSVGVLLCLVLILIFLVLISLMSRGRRRKEAAVQYVTVPPPMEYAPQPQMYQQPAPAPYSPPTPGATA